MPPIQVQPVPGQMSAVLSGARAFPSDRFNLGIPECLGDSARPVWFGGLTPTWSRSSEGIWVQKGERPGELDYELTVAPGEDYVDLSIRLANRSTRAWAHGMAFNCFNCGGSSLRDNECLRHWVARDGRLRRLIEVPRHFSPRPTVQLYGVEGAPRGRDIPFVAGFDATPDGVSLEGWIAIVSEDRTRLAAAVSRPALFLFQNMEYSCIHSAPDFGPVGPGETARGWTRLYLVEMPLDRWHARMKREMASPPA